MHIFSPPHQLHQPDLYHPRQSQEPDPARTRPTRQYRRRSQETEKPRDTKHDTQPTDTAQDKPAITHSPPTTISWMRGDYARKRPSMIISWMRGDYVRQHGGPSRASGRPTGGYTRSWRGRRKGGNSGGLAYCKVTTAPLFEFCLKFNI